MIKTGAKIMIFIDLTIGGKFDVFGPREAVPADPYNVIVK